MMGVMKDVPTESGGGKGPVPLEYYGAPERREASWAWWFWSGLWAEVWSELAEVPLWMRVPFIGLVLMVVGGFVWIVLAIVVHVIS